MLRNWKGYTVVEIVVVGFILLIITATIGYVKNIVKLTNFVPFRWSNGLCNAFFVGGPKDGQRIDGAAYTDDEFCRTAYKKEYLRDVMGNMHEVYFYDDDGRGLIQTLLDGYKVA